jgi:signal transduction histidine kinase
MSEELAIVPALRRTGLVCALGALATALLLGGPLSARVARPIRGLADAATALGAGQFSAPLPASRLREVRLLSQAFAEMRRALAARLADLSEANAQLADRNTRLSALQAELIQRDRLETTGRLVAQLAHEIRNPVANLRNCLEVIRRRVEHDPQARDFAELAIDELLRMHELAEQMLDINRPRDAQHSQCSPYAVAEEVVRLTTAGVSTADFVAIVSGEREAMAAIGPDACKQVLLNLVHNAREALATRVGVGRVEIAVRRADDAVHVEVADDGPGVPSDLRDRIFDAFFTTKADLRGVGLGLFVAEGIVRSAGGRMTVGGRPGGGAVFHITLPAWPDFARGLAPATATSLERRT